MLTLIASALLRQQLSRPPQLEPPDQPSGPDLYAVFSQSDAPAQAAFDALLFAELCEAVADELEYDGTLTPPAFTSGQHALALAWYLRDYCLAGRSLKAQYPRLPQALSAYWNPLLGTDGRPLEETDAAGRTFRSRLVSCFRVTADSSRHAAMQLEAAA
jgi:hypothetical protein